MVTVIIKILICLFVIINLKNDYSQSPDSAPKGQKLIAQGIALGLVSDFVRPVRAKALLHIGAFALTGRNYQLPST